MARQATTKSSNDREVQDLRLAHARLSARFSLLAQLLRRMAATLDLATVFQAVVEAACRLTVARHGALGVFDATGHIQEFYTHGISPEDRARIGNLPQGLGLLGWLHQTQKPLRLANLSQHPKSVGFPPNHPPMKTFLGVPIRHEGAALGNLYLTEKIGGAEFTPEDEELLVILADQAALAIRNARLHQQVEAARRRLETLVQSVPAGVLLADASTQRILLMNREAERIMGFQHQPEAVMEDYSEYPIRWRPNGTRYAWDELPIQRMFKNSERIQAEEIIYEQKDGRKIPALINAIPVFSDDGTMVGAIVVMQDITPLQELETLRNEFLGMVSHELKTPLTAIKGSAALVLGSKRPMDSEESHDLFQIIDQQADRLRDMVDNLLDMSRISAGSLSVSTEPTDLQALVHDALTVFSLSGNEHPVQLRMPETLPKVNADARRMNQVLSNLLSNAAKFSPTTAPITIAVTHNTHQATVSIQDQGRGIPPEKLHQLFRKFSQLPDSQGRRLPGAGLGLAICKGIVEAHGGRIWADSDGEGTGATFSFTLPLATEPAPVAGPDPSRRAAHVGRVSRPGERTRILAVDDEPQILRYLHRTLDEAGYQPTTTSDPAQVVPLLETLEPDLVLLDLALPGTSGYELLRRIREFSAVPVIFLTANAAPEEAVRALRLGADDYITKPFSPSELLARIEAALRRRVLPDQLEARPPFALGGLNVNFADRSVSVDDKRVALTATEYKLLYQLATNAGRVLTHQQLLHNVWGPEYSSESELVRSFIRNLRRKLGDDARQPRFIFTEPQVGYRMPRS